MSEMSTPDLQARPAVESSAALAAMIAAQPSAVANEIAARAASPPRKRTLAARR